MRESLKRSMLLFVDATADKLARASYIIELAHDFRPTRLSCLVALTALEVE